jgi:NAD(P)-dependent dehydrogenase (short-subunit alcohol dehydrogenase family)
VNPRGGVAQYDATKAAILSLTRTLAFEEAEHGERVNAVCPGPTLTPFHVHHLNRARGDLAAERVDNCLMRRWADPREIAFPILWLASDEASYIAGATLTVDGGQKVL